MKKQYTSSEGNQLNVVVIGIDFWSLYIFESNDIEIFCMTIIKIFLSVNFPVFIFRQVLFSSYNKFI